MADGVDVRKSYIRALQPRPKDKKPWYEVRYKKSRWQMSESALQEVRKLGEYLIADEYQGKMLI